MRDGRIPMRTALRKRLKRIETRFAFSAATVLFSRWHVTHTVNGEHWTREVSGNLQSLRFQPIVEIVVNKQRPLEAV